MERLTENKRNSDGTGVSKQSLIDRPGKGYPSNYARYIVTRLAELEDLEEQGLLLRLPCKVGTEVYNITWWDDVQEKVVVKGKTYCRTVHKHKVTKSTFSYFDIDEFGKTIFLTKEEAEAKLKEMEGAE